MKVSLKDLTECTHIHHTVTLYIHLPLPSTGQTAKAEILSMLRIRTTY